MTGSFSESIGNGLDLVASRTASHDFNFPSADIKYDGVKPSSSRHSVKRETPPSSLLLPQLSESRLPGFSSSLCDVFDASLENHGNGNIERNQQPRQGMSSHSTQQNQCGVSLLKNDNFSLSYSFRSQDNESNKSPIRDKIACKKETNFYRDDFERVREIYENSPENSKSKSGLPVTAPANTASIFRQRSDMQVPRLTESYGDRHDRREKSKTPNTGPTSTSRTNGRVPSTYDERKSSSENYRRVPTNSSFEGVPQNLLNPSFDVCLSDTDRYLGSLPLEGTFNSFGNDAGNEDKSNSNNSSCQDYKGDSRENSATNLNRRRHPGALVDGPTMNSGSSSPLRGSNRVLQRRGVDSKKGSNLDHTSEFPYKKDALATSLTESDSRSDGLNFYLVIQSYTKAFSDFSFLLPGLKDSMVDFNSQNKQQFGLIAQDTFIAKRRLASAVCAFGGLVGQKPKPLRNSSVDSIFRTKCEEGSDHGVSRKSRSRVKYEQKLPLRYYENEDRLSWEVEEHPLLEDITDDEDEGEDKSKSTPKTNSSIESSPRENDVKGHNNAEIEKSPSYDVSSSNKLQDVMKEEPTDTSANSSVSTSSNSGETPKMKYRCKLCGQPKQNHTCPYQQSLQRSIGTMSYPALNAFDANEPGEVAPPLSEMNNFVPGEDEQLQMQTPPRPKSISTHNSSNIPNYDDIGPNTVTPETRNNRILNSSTSPHSPPNSLPSALASMSPLSSKSDPEGNKGNNFTRSGNGKRRRTAVYSTRHKPRSRDTSNDPLFLETMEIKSEQFRVVTPCKDIVEEETYKYPTLPLTYGQRKKMSDSLFTLSKEVKGLTDECADVLRDARETDSWDLAVAELMAQIIVVLHCPKGDNRLKGLQRYLMTLGISC